jgi:hypothetical protein
MSSSPSRFAVEPRQIANQVLFDHKNSSDSLKIVVFALQNGIKSQAQQVPGILWCLENL